MTLYPNSSLKDNVALSIFWGRGKYHLFHSQSTPTDSKRECVFNDLTMDFEVQLSTTHHMAGPWWKPGTAFWIHANSCLKPGFTSTRFCFLFSSWGSWAPSVPNSIYCLTIWSALILWGLFSFGLLLMFRALQSMTWTYPYPSPRTDPTPVPEHSTEHWAAGLVSFRAYLSMGSLRSPLAEEAGLVPPTNSTMITFNPVNWPFGWTIATVRLWGREAA